MKNITTILSIIVILLAISLLFSFKSKKQEEEIIPCKEIQIMCRDVYGKFIINTQAEYEALPKARNPHTDCGNYQLPTIDFAQYTLIGVGQGAMGCEYPKVEHTITKTGNIYTFIVNIKQQFFCKMNVSVFIWCLIPKVEDSSHIKIQVNKSVEPRNEEEKKLMDEYQK